MARFAEFLAVVTGAVGVDLLHVDLAARALLFVAESEQPAVLLACWFLGGFGGLVLQQQGPEAHQGVRGGRLRGERQVLELCGFLLDDRVHRPRAPYAPRQLLLRGFITRLLLPLADVDVLLDLLDELVDLERLVQALVGLRVRTQARVDDLQVLRLERLAGAVAVLRLRELPPVRLRIRAGLRLPQRKL